MKSIRNAALLLMMALAGVFAMTACAQTVPVETEEQPKAASFREVLLGREAFSCLSDDGTVKSFTLKDYLEQEQGGNGKLTELTSVDMDGDGETEAVLRIDAPAGDAGGFLLLRQSDSGVEGFRLSYRMLWELKTDGTFLFSEQAGTGDGSARLAFDEEGCRMVKQCWAAGEMFAHSEFFLDGQSISEAEYETAMEAQSQKEDARWLEFTDASVQTLFPEGE